MKKISICFLSFLVLSGTLRAQENNIVPGNLLVMLGSDSQAQQLTRELKNINGIKTGFKLGRVISHSMHIYLFEFNASAIDKNILLNAVKVNPMVQAAQFNHTFEERNTPNDPQFSLMWNMHNTGQNGGTPGADIDALNAWDITTGGLTATGDTIVVAVIDGGFDITHEDLNFWKNYHEIPNNSIDDDNNGYVDDFNGWNSQTNMDTFAVMDHGTHLCGVIGAKGNNCKGVTGINWNVKVMPVSADGNLESNVVAAYTYVMDQRRLYNQTNGAKGAFVVSTNSSFGIDLGQPASYPLWCAMYDSLGSVGILSAGATTNSNINVDMYGDIPTACPSNWLITVTNTTNTGAKPVCGYGDTTIDLGAPGTGVISTISSNGYHTLSGTSIATPHVAGAIALMYSVACSQFMADYKSNPAAIALMVKDSLLGAVDPIPSLNGITVTGGRLNLFKSVRAIQNHYSIDSCPAITIVPYNCVPASIANNAGLDTGFEIKSVYPNPATTTLNIVYTGYEKVDISMVNLLGQEVKHVKANTTVPGIQQTTIDINGVTRGIYFLNLCNGNKKSNVVKVVVYE